MHHIGTRRAVMRALLQLCSLYIKPRQQQPPLSSCKLLPPPQLISLQHKKARTGAARPRWAPPTTPRRAPTHTDCAWCGSWTWPWRHLRDRRHDTAQLGSAQPWFGSAPPPAVLPQSAVPEPSGGSGRRSADAAGLRGAAPTEPTADSAAPEEKGYARAPGIWV